MSIVVLSNYTGDISHVASWLIPGISSIIISIEGIGGSNSISNSSSMSLGPASLNICSILWEVDMTVLLCNCACLVLSFLSCISPCLLSVSLFNPSHTLSQAKSGSSHPRPHIKYPYDSIHPPLHISTSFFFFLFLLFSSVYPVCLSVCLSFFPFDCSPFLIHFYILLSLHS